MFRDTPIFEFEGPWNVPVQIGASLIFLFVFCVDIQGDAASLKYDLVFFLVIILSIFLHEIGHAWGALIQNIPVRRVMIYGGGGFCEHAPSTRYEDELIVAMGPLTNLAVWALVSLLAPVFAGPNTIWLFYAIADVNLFLALFNLLPVFPLDGGRLFNLILCRLVHPELAGRISGCVGLVMVIVWAPMMLFSYISLGFILIFFPPFLVHWRLLRGEVVA